MAAPKGVWQWVAARQWVAVPVNMWQHLKVCGSMSVGGSICQCVALCHEWQYLSVYGSSGECVQVPVTVFPNVSMWQCLWVKGGGLGWDPTSHLKL